MVVEAQVGGWPCPSAPWRRGPWVPTHNILVSVESTDRDLLLAGLVARDGARPPLVPITVATQSFYVKQDILDALTSRPNTPWPSSP